MPHSGSHILSGDRHGNCSQSLLCTLACHFSNKLGILRREGHRWSIWHAVAAWMGGSAFLNLSRISRHLLGKRNRAEYSTRSRKGHVTLFYIVLREMETRRGPVAPKGTLEGV